MKSKQAAFTLVESIVAVAILSLVLVSVYGVFFSVLRSTETGAEAAVEVQRQRIALKTIEDALSGLIYYEQNKDIYAFNANTESQDYQGLSFVSRVPPDFLGNNLFGSERVRRITFQVEDDESGGRSLVMYQSSILNPDQEDQVNNQSSVWDPTLVTQNIPDSQRWVLGAGLDLFWLQFWSTKDKQWMVEWIEPDAPQPPARIRVELAYVRDDGKVTLADETQKREVVVFSESITQAMQNPALPKARSSSSSRGRSSSRGSSSGRKPPTAEQIAAYRKKREEDARKRNRENDGKRKLPEGSKRVSDYGRYQQTAKRYDANGDGILDSGERAKWRADWAASRNSQSSGGSKTAGSGGNTGAGSGGDKGAAGSGDTGSSGSGGGASRGGGPSVLPGALVLNGELKTFEARTLQELVDMGLYDSMDDLQATAPDGAVWGIDPDTGLVVPIYP